RHRRIPHFDGQIAARDHDAVRRIDDLLERRNGLGALDLRDQHRASAGRAHELARHVHVFLALREGDGEVVGLELDRGLDVVHVLRRQRGRRQAAAHAVDALVVRQRSTEYDTRDDPRTIDGFDIELDQSVIEQQHGSRPDVVDELAIIETDARRVAELAIGVEDEARAGHELDLAFREAADPYLRSLQVGHDRDLAPLRAGDLAHVLRALDMIGRDTVREIEPYDVHTG